MFIHLPGFLLLSAVVIITPGPDTVLTIRNILLGGRRAGFSTALGIITAQAIWGLATSLGLAALLVASKPAFVAVRLAGAVYLIVLGLRSLIGGWRGVHGDSIPPSSEPLSSRRIGAATAYRQGMLSNLGNPKMAIFFPSLLPQFVSRGETGFLSLFALCVVFSSLTLVWLTFYTLVISKIGDFLRRSRIRRAIDAVTGAILILMGLRLATEPEPSR
jgi:threonine/homoserine/homoserine lactone efflux protein